MRRRRSLFGTAVLVLLAVVATPAVFAAGYSLEWIGLSASLISAYQIVVKAV